jgi:hypothetical protein
MMKPTLFPQHRLKWLNYTGEGVTAVCATCGGAGETLTTHCPQAPLNDHMARSVFMRRVDFVHGEWVEPQKIVRRS